MNKQTYFAMLIRHCFRIPISLYSKIPIFRTSRWLKLRIISKANTAVLTPIYGTIQFLEIFVSPAGSKDWYTIVHLIAICLGTMQWLV